MPNDEDDLETTNEDIETEDDCTQTEKEASEKPRKKYEKRIDETRADSIANQTRSKTQSIPQ